MEDKFDKKSTKVPDREGEGKKTSSPECSSKFPEKSSTSSRYLTNLFAKLKGDGTNSEKSLPNISTLISIVEKRIRESYEIVMKKVTEFMEKDLPQLKNLSKDELSKINTALVDYKTELEKISQEKFKRVGEIKDQLQTRFMTAEEVKSFMKFFDKKILEIKTKTELLIGAMKKSEAAGNFTKDLQNVVAEYSNKLRIAMEKLFSALKETAGDLSKSSPWKKTLLANINKLPTTSDLQKLPSKLGNMLKKMSSSSDSSGKSNGKHLLPLALREKLPALNISKYFNSETMHGRANVAKATYIGALLYFLYWKMKSKS